MAFLKILKIVSYLFPYIGARWALKLFLTPRRFNRPESEKDWFNSADKKTLLCGYAINCWGNKSDPKILLVHGWEGRGAQLGAFAGPLVAQNFYVIALDGPAHGDSPGTQTNAGVFSKSLYEVQKELGDIHSVIAHSFGGGCALIATRLGFVTKKIVTIASPSDYLQVVNSFFDFVKVSPFSKKMAFQILEKKAGLKVSEINIASISQNLKIPGLIVHDENDKEVLSKNALVLNQAWPGSQILMTQGLGHRRILKDTFVIDEIIDFVKS